jgi:hypothetical protein
MIEIVTKRILYIATLGGILTMCGTAPITPPPAEACSHRLDGQETYCPPWDEEIKLPREEIRGEIDVYDATHWLSIQHMFMRNARREQIEKNMTQPDDALDSALEEYFANE